MSDAAPMQFLFESNGRKWYFAGDGFARKGIYFWNGKDNIHIDDALLAESHTIELRKALEYARPIVERWCHTQGNIKEFFEETLAPIDTALKDRT